MKLDAILAKNARFNMKNFDLEEFKRNYPSLYNTFVYSALEVADKSFVAGRSKRSFEDFKKEIL
jgi:hypothetical protein